MTKYFVGKIIGNKDDDNDLQVSYLRKSTKVIDKFVMPSVPDLKSVSLKHIKMSLPKPTTSGTRRQQNFVDFNEKFLSTLNLG